MDNEIIQSEPTRGLSTGVFSNPESFQEIYNIGKMFASSSLVPQAYQGKPMDCTIAVDMANRMGVNPMMVMQNLYVVQGKPSWSGQACTSMIMASGKFKNVRHVYTGEENTDSWGCYLEAERIDSQEIVKGAKVTIRMAKDEKWYDKNGSKWKTMPELMLAYRASAFFARVHIPNSLMGCAVEGEVEDITRSETTERAVDPFKEAIVE
ncbi:hypothetical protein [Lacrimispora sp.]|uniref:hypothetical protein n=1 Tax=Lacrimispora sp. TaxID=2719234 RepID=UPI0028615E8B|nr:hypothetical protein [Lacrimispora sp.]MDR7815150.1 hypothetical protein [Lacrimispora sp.]